jgi:hypothetical protein
MEAPITRNPDFNSDRTAQRAVMRCDLPSYRKAGKCCGKDLQQRGTRVLGKAALGEMRESEKAPT